VGLPVVGAAVSGPRVDGDRVKPLRTRTRYSNIFSEKNTSPPLVATSRPIKKAKSDEMDDPSVEPRKPVPAAIVTLLVERSMRRIT